MVRLLAFVVVVAVALLAYQVARTALSLRAAAVDVEVLRANASDGDWAAADRTARSLRSHADTARRSSDGWLWAGVARLPAVGDDATAVRQVSAALDELASRGVGPALEAGRQLQARPLRSDDGSFDLGAAEPLRAPLARAAAAAALADGRLDEVDADHLLPPLRPRVSELKTRLSQLDDGLGSASVMAGLLPDLLGADGPRRYLLVVQNNAEVRATGGLPGAASVLVARDGRLRIQEQGSAADFGPEGNGPPVAELRPVERTLFGEAMATDFRDANTTPDFPRAASLMAAMARREQSLQLDGVVAVDPVVFSEVLRATGPVEAAGRELTADNVVQRLLFEPYQRFPDDGDRQDAYFERVSAAVFDVLLGGSVGERGVLEGLGTGLAQRRVLFWSARPGEQQGLVDAGLAGGLPRGRGPDPEVGMYLNSATRAKIQYFLRYRGQVASRGCTDDGRQVVQARMRLRSEVPVPVSRLSPFVSGLGPGAQPGVNLVNLTLVAPRGATLKALSLGGEPVEVASGELYGRGAFVFPIRLEPGQSTEVVADFATSPGQDGDPRLEWTPGLASGATEDVAPSACG